MFSYERNRSEDTEYLYHQFDTNLNFHLHLHRSFEFIYVEEGFLELEVGGRAFSLGPNCAALILPWQLHTYTTPEFSRSYLCVFSCDFVYDFYTQIRGKEAEDPIFLLEDAGAIAMLSAPGLNRFRVKSVLYSLVGQFLAQCPLVAASHEGAELLERTIGYVQEHFCEPLSLRSLAAALGYHYNYLSAYLNERLGMHFSALVNQYRVDHACELLEQSELSMTEIAERCGFETIRSFNRNFARFRGSSPMAYRKARGES